ncbi:hypothetical protein E3N88_08525 [Mikania micrantha]|uniref:Uncharacterized protein n=1 Tax=Mikania micrantha TaxID=192012 RepID=A0A5N6PGG7_9ASTR|nr:hypothetical protein E3N88_08525 [Mikania micrantha]
MLTSRETMIVTDRNAKIGSKLRNWAYWAQPRPIAVCDGHPNGPSRYAKPRRENLNSPNPIADELVFNLTMYVEYALMG